MQQAATDPTTGKNKHVFAAWQSLACLCKTDVRRQLQAQPCTTGAIDMDAIYTGITASDRRAADQLSTEIKQLLIGKAAACWQVLLACCGLLAPLGWYNMHWLRPCRQQNRNDSG